jgi:hypothetical protein
MGMGSTNRKLIMRLRSERGAAGALAIPLCCCAWAIYLVMSCSPGLPASARAAFSQVQADVHSQTRADISLGR